MHTVTGFGVRASGFRNSWRAKGSICTPVRGTGFGVSELAACKRLDLHTGTGYWVRGSGFGVRCLAVCKRLDLHTCTGYWVRGSGFGVRGFGTRGVQKARFAHRNGVLGSGSGFGASRCVKGSILHTGTGYGVLGSGFGASRCAKGSICTPLRGYRSRGVQKVRFAHRDGGSGSCTLTRWCVQVLMDSIPELWLRTHGID